MSWNFALILLILLVVTGIVWSLDRFWLRARRQASGASTPWWVEYSVSFFPVILFVFVLRSFVVEPFRIPSGSMLPTLQSGDLILVNKFSYGIRLPVADTKIIETGNPKRGDVMVFRYPVEPQVDYIKRVVGLPGDEVAYLDKALYINGKLIPHERDGDYFEPDRVSYVARYNERLGEVDHQILLDERRSQDIRPIWRFPNMSDCQYLRNGVRCTVPAGQYFVMGDNRDNSLDSRYWGFVPDANIVGRAFFIWMNFGDLGRIGRFH